MHNALERREVENERNKNRFALHARVCVWLYFHIAEAATDGVHGRFACKENANATNDERFSNPHQD